MSVLQQKVGRTSDILLQKKGGNLNCGSNGSVCVLIGFCMITSFNENEIISTKILQVLHCQLKELLMNVKREDCILM